MPRHLIPHKSGLHRIAAIALYRALLTQCRTLQVSRQEATELQNIIQNRFKEHRYVTSHRQLSVNFTAGYQAIDHLDNAVAGDEQSRAYLLSLLQRAPASAKRPWQRKELDAERKIRLQPQREERERAPKLSLWDRPLPLEKLSGKRHVPVLVNANHTPVLRLKKPQPESLSTFINARILQRQKRQNLRWQLEEELELANREDQWDAILSQVCGTDVREGARGAIRDPRWQDDVFDALQEHQRTLQADREKNTAMARKMQEVVDREREIFERERAEEKENKRIAKTTKRAKRKVIAAELKPAMTRAPSE